MLPIRQIVSDDSAGSIGTSLLRRVKERDPLAWQRLAQIYGPLVYRWSLRANLQAADAEDVVQDVFARLATGIAGFRREQPGDTFRGWLWTITRHKLADYYRRKAAAPQFVADPHRLAELASGADEEIDDSSFGTGTDDVGSLYHRALELIRNEFEERSWQAFWQVAVEGRTAADVAAQLGMTTNAVYIAKSRVFRRLRDELS